jgi:hypothetical protein
MVWLSATRFLREDPNQRRISLMNVSTRNIIAIAAVSLPLSVAAAAQTAPLSIVEACTRTVNDYAWYMDHPIPDANQAVKKFADLFTKDAQIVLHDDNLELIQHIGHEQISDRYLDFQLFTKYLHVTSNIRITPISDTTAKGTSYTSFFMHLLDGSMVDEGAIKGLWEYRDEYQIVDGVCKISKREENMRYMNLFSFIADPEPE